MNLQLHQTFHVLVGSWFTEQPTIEDVRIYDNFYEKWKYENEMQIEFNAQFPFQK